jgi:transcriptional regulator with XRE-family HTH domain
MDPKPTLLISEARRSAETGRGEGIRRAAKLSLSDIAAAIGVTPGAVGHWEKGRRRPSGDAARRYIRLLGILEREIDESETRQPPSRCHPGESASRPEDASAPIAAKASPR